MRNIPVYKFAIREDLKNCGINFLPTRGTPDATGWDVKAAFSSLESFSLSPGETTLIPLGFRIFCPKGWWIKLNPRSSTFAKKHLHCLYGIIDEDFYGECRLAVQYLPNFTGYAPVFEKKIIEFGEALGQIIPVKRQEMAIEEISNEEFNKLTEKSLRDPKGFGTTVVK